MNHFVGTVPYINNYSKKKYIQQKLNIKLKASVCEDHISNTYFAIGTYRKYLYFSIQYGIKITKFRIFGIVGTGTVIVSHGNLTSESRWSQNS
jgi:hypothetical protein